MSNSIDQQTKTQNPSAKIRARAEAERRAKFVRGMGSALVGYSDGYADGFEHAVAWLLGETCDPLTIEYRPDSGMKFSKDYYRYRPKERARMLEIFEKMGGEQTAK